MRPTHTLSAFAALLIGAAFATASPAAAQGSAPQTRNDAPREPAAEPEKKVCRSIGKTGTRLAAKRVCRTRAEWTILDREAVREAKEYTDGYMTAPAG